MDHCHVIVKADTTWKEDLDWIFKKSGIDIHWFIFTTDTLYLVECTLSIIRTNDQAKQSSRDVEFIVYCMLEALCIVYVQALMYLFGSFCMGVFFLIFFLHVFFFIL